MINFRNGGRLVQSLSELPTFNSLSAIYADFETTSGDPKLDSLDPWRHCGVAGLAITVDNAPGAWYIPASLGDSVIDWWEDVLSRAQCWINHNIKYDAHVSTNAWGILPECKLICTLTLAKMIDSDRFTYGLDVLSREWLNEEINQYEEAFKPYLHDNKDYGAVPVDIMAEYACQDVITNRRLMKYIDERLPEQCYKVRDVEIELTSVLFRMERNGLRVNPTSLILKELEIYEKLFAIDRELTDLTGRSFRPHVNEDCYDVLCNQYGLPVLAYTDDEADEEDLNPSFDKHALAQYAAHPFAPHKVVEKIIEYRKLNTMNNLFIKKLQERHIDGVVHPSYNQAVRTFRMSCKKPNAQQFSVDAKELVVPGEGHSFISIDYSQIEFRLMVHYIQDRDAIAAYLQDSAVDFHNWVADMCSIDRKPAKTINFLMGFGGGKARLLGALSQCMELVGSLKEQVDGLVQEGKVVKEQALDVFNMLATAKAGKVYDEYHARLPGIKRISRQAMMAAKMKGYVFNIAGRRRHLRPTRAHIAFNTLNQSSAADIMKERTVAADKFISGTPIEIVASVHDETLFRAPTEMVTPSLVRELTELMEATAYDVRVPLRCAVGVSDKNWKMAVKSAKVLDK